MKQNEEMIHSCRDVIDFDCNHNIIMNCLKTWYGIYMDYAI